MGDRLAVYTVIMGDGYRLPKRVSDSNVDYICFTNMRNLDARGWDIRHVEPLLPSDLARSSREQKIRPHRWLGDYRRSIYIDPSVQLNAQPSELWDHLIGDKELAFAGFWHSFRKSVGEELASVRAQGLDDDRVFEEQFNAYAETMPHALNLQPLWGAVLARHHNEPDCIDAMETWFAHVLRFSRRDQLSLPLALSSLDEDRKNILNDDNYNSKFHTWPAPDYVRPDRYVSGIEGKKDMMKAFRRKVKGAMKRSPQLRKFLKDDVSRITATQSVNLLSGRVVLGLDPEQDMFFAHDKRTRQKVYVSDRKRLELYRQGTAYRESWLLRDYRLPVDLIELGDKVIDIGANVGELGRWVEASGGHYMGFEPDPKAFKALRKNVESEDIYDVALSDTSGSAEFYLSTEHADSSLFQPNGVSEKITVQKIPLDDFLADKDGWGSLKLIKIEAEGMEPEVIAGALETLKRAEYIAVDAGPERGGENTVPDVLNSLMPLGFEVVSCFLTRGTFFLRKIS